MFGWLKKKPSSEAQLSHFITMLAKSEAQDLGLATATVEHTANTNFIFGDFYKPKALIEKRPEMIAWGIGEVQRLQSCKLEVMAVGWIVWTHTFRASFDPSLTSQVKSMWALLVRGAPYAHDQSMTLYPLIGFALDVSNPARIPEGFT